VLNTAGLQIPTTGTIINAVANNPASSPNLTAANTAFGSIAPNGAEAFFQNVFFNQNNYPTFFRIANASSTPVPVFFVLSVGGGMVFNGTATPALAPNSAQFFTASQLASIVGFTPSTGSASGSATVRLFSPAQNVLFSALSLNPATGDLAALP
jgi:hypothetical protein